MVDDDPTVADVVGRYLIRDGHTVECVHDGYEALRRVAEQPPDLVVLDLMLPGIDGLEVCRRLRERWPIPVVMLTALGDETDRLVGFETGADDYVTKPFSPRELAMRVRSVLRRARGSGLPDKPDRGVISDRELTVDLAAHEVRAGGKLIQLTSREYDLLVFLMRNPRKAFTREQLLNEVWGWTFGDTSTVTITETDRAANTRSVTSPIAVITSANTTVSADMTSRSDGWMPPRMLGRPAISATGVTRPPARTGTPRPIRSRCAWAWSGRARASRAAAGHAR